MIKDEKLGGDNHIDDRKEIPEGIVTHKGRIPPQIENEIFH